MMYSNKVSICIKHNGKVLKEEKDLVRLPYGSQYSVLVKNLNSRRMKFKLHIDGADALDGEELVVMPNSDLELKRFIKGGNLESGNSFKFIERTEKIENGPRGIKIDDGLIRLEFSFEQEKSVITTTHHYHYDHYHDWDYYRRYNQWPYDYMYGGLLRSVNNSSTLSTLTSNSVVGQSAEENAVAQSSMQTILNNIIATATSINTVQTPVNDVGITVPGEKIEQKFVPINNFISENISHVIIMRLSGYFGDKELTEPILVRSKQTCETCGRKNKATSKFCTECGTCLDIG